VRPMTGRPVGHANRPSSEGRVSRAGQATGLVPSGAVRRRGFTVAGQWPDSHRTSLVPALPPASRGRRHLSGVRLRSTSSAPAR
jgi:hypothetical protein